jgi:hypothetical protein
MSSLISFRSPQNNIKQTEASDQDDTNPSSHISPPKDDDTNNSHSSEETISPFSHISYATSISPTNSKMLALGSGQQLPIRLTHNIYEGTNDDFPIWRRDMSKNEQRSIHSSAFYSVH